MTHWADKQLVVQLHDMARKYDSDFLRRVADRMDFMIEEKRRNEQLARLETLERSPSTTVQ